VTTSRDSRGRFVRVEQPSLVSRCRRRQVRLPDGWVYSLAAAVLAVALGLAIGMWA